MSRVTQFKSNKAYNEPLISPVNGKPLRLYKVRAWNKGEALNSETYYHVYATSIEDAEYDAWSGNSEDFDYYEATEIEPTDAV